MSIDFTYTDAPQDEVPTDLFTGGITDACEKCGVKPKAPYGGRGPKPRFCVDCKGGSKGTPKVSGENARLAAQATAVLMQTHNFFTLGMMMAQLHKTARTWSDNACSEDFRKGLYDDLVLDPELCRWICRGGIKSAKFALALRYGMVIAAVAPVAYGEITDKRAEKARQAEEEEQEQAHIVETKQVWQAA